MYTQGEQINFLYIIQKGEVYIKNKGHKIKLLGQD